MMNFSYMGRNRNSPRFCSQFACYLDHDFGCNRHKFSLLTFQISSGYNLLKSLQPLFWGKFQ